MSDPPATARSRLAWMQLVRLPNVFTAMADVAMGFLVTNPTPEPLGLFLLLLIASSGFYLGGMVLNDWADVEEDRRERPGRPLPSGRVSVSAAGRLAAGLFFVGIFAGTTASIVSGSAWAAGVSWVLGLLVWAYDRSLKRLPVGPVAMGGCRMLNVLLGMSASAAPRTDHEWIIALGLGVYVAGVTWFARTEATVSRRFLLIDAAMVMLTGLAILLISFRHADPIAITILASLIGVVAGACLRGVARPNPVTVQQTVKTLILLIIAIDAAIVFAVRGPWPAIGVLMLLIPAIVLGRFVYST